MWKKGVLFIISILLAGGVGWWAAEEWRDDDITASDAEEIVTSRYEGEVTSNGVNDEGYLITLQRDTGVYEITVDKKTARVKGVEQIEKSSTADEAPEEPPEESPPEEETETLLTEAEAEQIGLSEVSGEVDDVDYEQDGSTPFYLVEIEQEDGPEAVVQIHAITGDVMSVTWDD